MTFHTGLSRDGPGLLVRDLLKDAADADLERIATLKPDVVALQNVDYDYDQVAMALIRQRLSVLGHEMTYAFAALPNTGIESGFDLDRNGKLGEPRDMLGYGRFAGQGGMLLLSRFPLVFDETSDLSKVLWRDEDDANLPPDNYFSSEILEVLPLHSVGAWDVAVDTPSGRLRILTSHASTPVFDGPEDRNGLRNAAELRFWRRYISRPSFQIDRFVLMGAFNNDVHAGEGRKHDIQDLLTHTAIQDPMPKWGEGRLVTAEWESGLALRVDYVLPSRGLGVRAAKVERSPIVTGGSRHHPVWVDVTWQ